MKLAEACQKAHFTTDQLEDMGAIYKRLTMDSTQWGWLFPDNSLGYYTKKGEFKVIK